MSNQTPQPDELEQILQSYKGDTQAVDEDAVLRQYPEKLNQAHDDNLQEAKQAIQALIRTEKLELLAEVREQKKTYLTELAWKNAATEDAVPIEALTKLEAEL